MRPVLLGWLVLFLLDLEEIVQRLVVLEHPFIVLQGAFQVENGSVDPMKVVDVIDVGGVLDNLSYSNLNVYKPLLPGVV